jgi:hypothetical protein
LAERSVDHANRAQATIVRSVSDGRDSFQQFMFRPGGFLVPSASGEFLMKNIALFGLGLGLLAHAIDAIRKTSNAGHQPNPFPLRRTLRFMAPR